MHQCKMESQEGLKVTVESKMNMYQKHDCQTKGQCWSSYKNEFFLNRGKRGKVLPGYKHYSMSRVSTGSDWKIKRIHAGENKTGIKQR